MSGVVLRRCRVCRTQLPTDALLRWTVQDGQLIADAGKKALARGYYSCSPKCAEILPKTIKTLRSKSQANA